MRTSTSGFPNGRIELIEDFPDFDRNGDGRVDDNDLLFAVTLRSGKPERSLLIPDADNTHFACFIQDDWRVHPQLTLNLGLRYELDTDVKNVSRVNQLNPIILPFLLESETGTPTTLGRELVSIGHQRWPHEYSRRLRYLLRSHHARDSIARARIGWPRLPLR